MRTTSSIAFFCRPSKANRQGLSPLECSVTLSGQRKFLNLPMRFKPEEFNRKRPSPEILEALDLWRARINSYMVQMMREGMVITAETLRETVQSGGTRSYTCSRLFSDYLIILKKRVLANDLQPSVYRKYQLVAERALKIIGSDKYQVLPHLTNQYYNRALKLVNKTYSSHLGRRTYASIMKAHNAPMEVVAAALGDDVKTTMKYYEKVLDSTIIKEQIKVMKK